MNIKEHSVEMGKFSKLGKRKHMHNTNINKSNFKCDLLKTAAQTADFCFSRLFFFGIDNGFLAVI